MIIKCGARVHWGYQTNYLVGDNIRGMKLLLDEPQNPGYVASLIDAGLLKRSRIPAVTLTGMYLTGLVDHTKKILQRRFGRAAEQMEMQYVLTVPAIWSDKAKDATLKAASRAKIPQKDITLVSEPEAAALYCLNAIQPNSIENNDVVVVCDAGGGTVDLISYRVTTVSSLCLEEVAEGTGDICGSVMLDAGFKNFLKVLVNDKHLSVKSCEVALRYWQDHIKPNFASDPDFEEETHFVPLPGLKDKPKIGLQDGFLQLDGAQIKRIFDPVVDRVKVQIIHQVNAARAEKKPVKAILLVGGFGSSEYLYRCIQETFSDIIVMQPPNSWSAVMLGAVQYGLKGNQVKKRIARCHYGGDVIQQGEPVRMKFNTKIAVDGTAGIISKLKICLRGEAPKRCDSGVYELCTFAGDLRNIPTHLFKKRTNSKGKVYYKVEHVLVMTPQSASIKFELEFNGQLVGEVQANYFE
ncbi:hypothetical protein CBS11852_10300 [Aspergillus niger]|nr:hypothetical protein CBS133816_5605 [Aspergillus niger]KAI2877538.1 hypothetical protein CBS11852_10300 [Aspergillus niger]